MDKNSTIYTFSFAAIVTLIVAVVLTYVSVGLAPLKEANELTYKKRDILSGVMDVDPLSNDSIIVVFDERIEQILVDYEGNVIEDSEVSAIDIDLKKEKKKPSQADFKPAYEGADYSKKDIAKMSKKEKQSKIDGYTRKRAKDLKPKNQGKFKPAYEGADYSKKDIAKMSEKEKIAKIDGYTPKKTKK